MLILSISTIMLKDAQRLWPKRISRSAYWISTNLGKSKFIFSVVYIAAAISYYTTPDKAIAFLGIITFWICVVFFDIVGMVVQFLSKLFGLFKEVADQEIGTAIGCENPLLYNVEIDFSKHRRQQVNVGDLVSIETNQNIGSLGLIVSIKFLLNKRWLTIYLLKDESGKLVSISLTERKIDADSKSVFSSENRVYLELFDSLKTDVQPIVQENYLFKNKDKFIGHVERDSNINTIKFSLLADSDASSKRIVEGAILSVPIYGQPTLYQVINGSTATEHLEKLDSHGYTIGIARKLGKYDVDKKELDVRKWMPEIYSPVFMDATSEPPDEKLRAIAQRSIGRLPGSELETPIREIDSIVTHNTAILGILGIGKSCLAYELVQKLVGNDIRIICIDITNEWIKELVNYLPANRIISDTENSFNEINSTFERVHYDKNSEHKDVANVDKSGNKSEYRRSIRKDLCQFLFSADDIPENLQIANPTLRVRIFNPDYHRASQGEKIGYNVITTELTQAEKTRIITEEIFKILMKLGVSETKRARVCVVYEEAHSLIPEWNSVANEGDKAASNGTAKVILQGRKYGLGCMVITQRTANVSKSILNQCNTVFALRVFDDTGKAFLENYIGKDYADTLATLEEQHAIAIGKGLKLKQPVIIRLNDRKFIMTNQQTETGHEL